MKQQVSPIVAILVVVAVIGIVALAWVRFSGGAGSREGEKPPGMPPEAAAEFQRRMGGMTGPTGGANPMPPGGGSGGGVQAPTAPTTGGGAQ